MIGMLLIKNRHTLSSILDKKVAEGKTIGFVPTMGALHEGHVSLVNSSGLENNVTVCSIFVNPSQFNDASDFEKYPVRLEQDIQLLENSKCDIVFFPSRDGIYPASHQEKKYILGYLENILEGKYRPGHFQGVCQVVDILLQIVKPDKLYLGQKDYQQCLVIDRLVHMMGLKEKVEIKIRPTVREMDGLAMSSRNLRLNDNESKNATMLNRSLNFIKKNWQELPFGDLLNEAKKMLTDNELRIDYVEIADAETLQLVNEWDRKQKLVAVVAAFAGEVRLIDNMILN